MPLDMTDGRRTPSRWLRRARASVALVALAGILQLGSAGAESVEGPATVTREAYFTTPITQITPPLLRAGFPPATACLVAGLVGVEQLCGPEVQQLGGLLGLSDGIPILVTPDGDLAQPVLPGTTPVGMIAGQQRYSSLLQIALPTLPAGERLARLELVLKADGLNFAIESPAVRDLVLQVVSQLAEQDPTKIVDAVERALSGEVPVVTDTITGIEACPAVEPWASGAAQGAGLDGTRLPDVNCLLGTTGAYDPAARTFTFDLTFAAQAWLEGKDGQPFANEGIVLRPLGAPNLAYGDPDLSTNWLVSLGTGSNANGATPVLRYSTVPADPAPPASGGTGGGTAALPPLTGGGAPVDFGPLAPTGPASVGGALSARFAEREPHDGGGGTPGWVWLALPLGILGAVLLGQALGAEPSATRRRPGALSHLVATEELAAAPSAASPTHPRGAAP
jgi:hypothetical protein